MMSFYKALAFIYAHPLSRGHGVSSLIRFFRWQIMTRSLNMPVIIPFVNATRLIAERGIICGSGTYYVGLLEFEHMAFVLHYLRPKDLFIDVGANIGLFTLLAAGVVGAQSVCIEPIPQTYQRLLDNVNINRLQNLVKAQNIGLSDTSCKLQFTTNHDAVNYVTTEFKRNNNIAEVEVRTLDSIVQNQVPELIKIDVEGFETKVIEGGQRTFSNNQGPNAVLMELRGHGSRYGFNEQDLHRRMLEYGYGAFVYDPISRELNLWRENDEGKFGDMLYIRQIEKAKSRVREASPFRILGKAI